jgi:two-component system, chemotaxis family, sensor kinase CheA
VTKERETIRTYAAARSRILTGWGSSLATRFAFGTVLLIAAVTTLLVSELTRLEWQRLSESKRSAATMMAELLAGSLEAALDFGDREAVKERVGTLRSSVEILHAAVFAKDQGEPLAQYQRSDGEGCSATDCVVVIQPVINPGQQEIGSVSLSVSLEREKQAFNQARSRLVLLGAFFSIGLASVLIMVARRVLVTPISRLEAAAQGLASGALVEVPVVRADELGRLSRTFNVMAHTINERERRIETSNRRLQSLLDNMGQAIVVFGADGTLTEEHSRQAERVFGVTAGVAIAELLFPSATTSDMEREAFKAWIEVAFNAGVDGFADLVSLAPRTAVVHRGSEELELDLEFRPVPREEQAYQIMLLATDVTEKRRLERSVAQKEAEHEAQLSAVRRLVGGGGQLFAGFIENAHQRLATCKELLASAKVVDRVVVEGLFQQFHTLRAEARCFDLAEVEARVRELEEVLGQLRRASSQASDAERAALATGMDRLGQLLGEAEQAFIAQSPLGAAALDQITVRRSRFLELLDSAQKMVGPVRDQVEELAGRPLVESTALLPEAVARWAERAGKSVAFHVDHRGIEIPFALSRVLGGVLSHLLRNAIAHGIESESDRHAANKSGTGTIRISAEKLARGVAITVADDGRGFDLEAFGQRLNGSGIDHGRGLNIAFESGFSTSSEHGELAGAGVGLAAARAELLSVGYCIQVVSTSPRGTELRLSPIKRDNGTSTKTAWQRLAKS